ncbi:MAG: helix-turn-helix domain-containing protein [Thaumarchaeota archaeon]|nr:helix-turn-helix domain-containing protein [Nitrososphaerota archaeon]
MKTGTTHKIAASPIRLRLLELLQQRPRTLPELARELDLTTQAVFKHVNILAENKIVEKIILDQEERQRPRHLYRLSATIDAVKSDEDGVFSLHLFVKPRAEESVELRRRTTSKKIFEIIQDIEEEARSWRRRLRLVRQREKRLFLLIAALGEERNMLLKKVGFTTVDEALLAAYLDGVDQAGLIGICKGLNVEPEAADRFLRKISEVWRGEG